MAAMTVVLPVPGGPWMRAMSGVFRATWIALSCFSVGGFLKTLFRTKAVSGLIRLWRAKRGDLSALLDEQAELRVGRATFEDVPARLKSPLDLGDVTDHRHDDHAGDGDVLGFQRQRLWSRGRIAGP
jgi:hypothetical protein